NQGNGLAARDHGSSFQCVLRKLGIGARIGKSRYVHCASCRRTGTLEEETMFNRIGLPAAALTAALLGGAALAQDGAAPDAEAVRVGITKDMAQASYTTPEGEFTVQRDQTEGAR